MFVIKQGAIMAERIIGIDLGTTYSVVSVLENGEPIIIPTAEGNKLCPSVVAFTPSGDRLVGEIAKRQALTHPERTIASIKRQIGTRNTVEIDGHSYTPQEISAMILQKLHADAEAFLGEKIHKAVITVPAYYNDAQRQATKDAGRIAGLEVIRIVNEPTAAALAYGMDRKHAHTVLVWDLGGGTFDVSILSLGSGVYQVLSTNGDTRLGGDDWDESLAGHLLREFHRKENVNIGRDRLALQRLKDAAETAKIELSVQTSATINLPFLAAAGGQPKHLETVIEREDFENFTAHLRERMVRPTMQALSDARVSVIDLDAVILVGGSTRMPAIQQMARDILLQEPVIGVNPDEVVALGAAVQGGIISGDLDNMVLLDVTPLSLGLETANGAFVRIIPRNTTIPTSQTKCFTTTEDSQQAVDVHILQGERDLAAQNKSLGRFNLFGLNPSPRRVPRIDVTFDIDENGIVHVTAIDQATGVKQEIHLQATSGISEDEILSMIQDAEAYADVDKHLLELVDLQVKGDDLMRVVNNRLDNWEGRIPITDLTRFDRDSHDFAKHSITEMLLNYALLSTHLMT